MSDNTLQDALTMALDAQELPPFLGADVVDTTATAFATWMFEQQADAGEDEEAQLMIVQQAISAAYIAGCLDTSNMSAQEIPFSVEGRHGAVYNFYFS